MNSNCEWRARGLDFLVTSWALVLLLSLSGLAQQHPDFSDVRLEPDSLGPAYALEYEKVGEFLRDGGVVCLLEQVFSISVEDVEPYLLKAHLRYGSEASSKSLPMTWDTLYNSYLGSDSPNPELGELGDLWRVSYPDHVQFIVGQRMMSIAIETNASSDVISDETKWQILRHIKNIAFPRLAAGTNRMEPLEVDFEVTSEEPLTVVFSSNSQYSLSYCYIVLGRPGEPDEQVAKVQRRRRSEASMVLIEGLAPGGYRLELEVFDEFHRSKQFLRNFVVSDSVAVLSAPGREPVAR